MIYSGPSTGRPRGAYPQGKSSERQGAKKNKNCVMAYIRVSDLYLISTQDFKTELLSINNKNIQGDCGTG